MRLPLSARRRLQLARDIEALGLKPIRGFFFRNIAARFRPLGLSALGSIAAGARWNRRGELEALYFADSPITALFEVGALTPGAGTAVLPQPIEPRIELSVDINLTAVLDLREATVRSAIGLTDANLRAPWLLAQRTGRTVPQEVAVAAIHAGAEALLVPSVATPMGATNLVVFPNALRSGSSLVVYGSDLARDRMTGR